MSPLRSLCAALAVALAFLALPAAAATFRLGPVEVVDPWSRPAAPGMNGVGYMTIKNNGKTPLVLTGASTPLAAKVTLHRTSMAGGVMRMSPVAGGLTIAPGAAASLSPAGYHMMLERLTKPLALGQRAPATLTFADGRKLQIELSVQTGPAAAAGGGAMGGMPGMHH